MMYFHFLQKNSPNLSARASRMYMAYRHRSLKERTETTSNVRAISLTRVFLIRQHTVLHIFVNKIPVISVPPFFDELIISQDDFFVNYADFIVCDKFWLSPDRNAYHNYYALFLIIMFPYADTFYIKKCHAQAWHLYRYYSTVYLMISFDLTSYTLFLIKHTISCTTLILWIIFMT